MKKIPSILRERLDDPDSRIRESAILELAQYPSGTSLKLLKKLLSDESLRVRNVAAMSLVEIGGTEVVDTILGLLRSQDASVRNIALDVIIRVGPEAVDRVAGLLEDRDKDIRKFAVDILDRIGSRDAEVPLIGALFDENMNVAGAAADALGKCGTEAAVPHMATLLHREPWLRCSAARGLGAIGGDLALNALLAADPDKEESMVLFSIVNALGAMADRRALPFLFGLIDSDKAALEPAVVQAIEKIIRGVNDDPARELDQIRYRILPEKLIGMLKSTNTETVRSAIGLLGMFGNSEADGALVKLLGNENRPLLEDLEAALIRIKPKDPAGLLEILDDPMEPDSIKAAAVRIMRESQNPGNAEALSEFLPAAGDALKVEIIRALAVIKDARVLPRLHELPYGLDEAVKLECIHALETFMDPSSVTHLMDLRNDSSESVRFRASQSLKQYDLRDRREEIRQFLRSENPETVCFGLNMLSDSPGSDFTDEITALFQGGNMEIRKAALMAAGRLENEAGFAAVSAALQDESPEIRLTALRCLENYPGRIFDDLLMKMAGDDSEPWVSYEAVRVIGKLGILSLLPRLAALLESASDLTAASILDVLGEWGGDAHRAAIEACLNHENELVREAAADALNKQEKNKRP